MSNVYGYCRISTKKQNIERQERNIREQYPTAIIFKEAFTGTKIDRPQFSKLLKIVKAGDTIVFDEVSRMSRNADDGVKLYMKLYAEGINLVFLKESYINTETYKSVLNKSVPMTGTDADYILEGVNKYLMALAEKQIRLAFEQAQKEVDELHKRTSEGVRLAIANGKHLGPDKGSKVTTKKSVKAKEQIKKYSKDFDGTLNDIDTIKIVGVSRNSYYKYKRELEIAIEEQRARYEKEIAETRKEIKE